MSNKHGLRLSRYETVINKKSKKQDKDIDSCVMNLIDDLSKNHPQLTFVHIKDLKVKDIVDYLKTTTGNDDFHCEFETSSIRPDGGILFIKSKDESLRPILIAERKNQGTNDIRLLEGKKKQGKGNAIERLGKNVTGLRTLMITEKIFPFVCFGDGCDFDETSTIRDRVVTINQFGKLNHIYVKKENGLERGSFFFREKLWTNEEMYHIMMNVAEQSIQYYKENGTI